MPRFFIISLLIHGFFYSLIQLSLSPQVIDDPIVSVSYSEPNQNSEKKRAVKAKINSAPNENQKTTEESPQTSTQGNQIQTSSVRDQAFDSQIVSEKPRVLYQEKAPYPLSAKNARIEGPVKLSVTIDRFGRVVEVIVLEGPGHDLNETAAAAMKNFKFSPAQKDGQSVAVRITYIYRFKLESR